MVGYNVAKLDALLADEEEAKFLSQAKRAIACQEASDSFRHPEASSSTELKKVPYKKRAAWSL